MEDWQTIATQHGYADDHEMFSQLYAKGLSTSQIATLCHVTPQCIRRRMKLLYQMKLRPQGGTLRRSLLYKAACQDPSILNREVGELCKQYQVTRWSVYSLRRSKRKLLAPSTTLTQTSEPPSTDLPTKATNQQETG